jgi:hypothetical protein
MRSVGEEETLQDSIVKVVHVGDMLKLERWARQGIRVDNPYALLRAAADGRLDLVKLLVTTPGADANEARKGITPLLFAARMAT